MELLKWHAKNYRHSFSSSATIADADYSRELWCSIRDLPQQISKRLYTYFRVGCDALRRRADVEMTRLTGHNWRPSLLSHRTAARPPPNVLPMISWFLDISRYWLIAFSIDSPLIYRENDKVKNAIISRLLHFVDTRYIAYMFPQVLKVSILNRSVLFDAIEFKCQFKALSWRHKVSEKK